METIAILRASVGPHDTEIIMDPYWDAPDWHEAARGDGRSYSLVQWVHREEGEGLGAFIGRAGRLAEILEARERR